MPNLRIFFSKSMKFTKLAILHALSSSAVVIFRYGFHYLMRSTHSNSKHYFSIFVSNFDELVSFSRIYFPFKNIVFIIV